MKTRQRLRFHLAIRFGLGLVLAGGSAVAWAESVAPPPHAHARTFGAGWECDRGYRKSGELCTALTIPRTAHLDSSGNDWICDPGYERKVETCSAGND